MACVSHASVLTKLFDGLQEYWHMRQQRHAEHEEQTRRNLYTMPEDIQRNKYALPSYMSCSACMTCSENAQHTEYVLLLHRILYRRLCCKFRSNVQH